MDRSRTRESTARAPQLRPNGETSADSLDIGLIVSQWTLPRDDGTLLERIERMILPAVLGGAFARSSTARVCGLQYHLGGAQDTRALARLAGIRSSDRVLDVCCFLGGPAVQLALDCGCHVTGVDVNETVIAAATRIASLAELEHLLKFCVADARRLPFPNARFSVVWCQASVAHDDSWLQEFDRVLEPGGRLAITLETRPPPHRWSLPAIAERVAGRGYTLLHADDLTARDIEIGWRLLDAKLTANQAVYANVLGEAWVANARQEFADEIARMRAGQWGNGRIVARKLNGKGTSGRCDSRGADYKSAELRTGIANPGPSRVTYHVSLVSPRNIGSGGQVKKMCLSGVVGAGRAASWYG